MLVGTCLILMQCYCYSYLFCLQLEVNIEGVKCAYVKILMYQKVMSFGTEVSGNGLTWSRLVDFTHTHSVCVCTHT